MALLGRQSHSATLIVLVSHSGVSVGAVRLDGTPHILASEHAQLPVSERTPEQAFAQVTTLAAETCTRFVKAYGAGDHASRYPLTAVEVHLGAAYVEADTASQTARFDSPLTVASSHIDNGAKAALSSLPATNRFVLESNVIRVHVNGYPTARPVGKTGSHVTVTVFRSTVDESVKRSLEIAITSVLPGHTPIFRSFARDLMFVLKEHTSEAYHLVIDMEEEASHCVALRRDDIAAHATLPMGSTTLLSKMAADGSVEETRTLIRLAGKDSCSTAACESIKAKLASVEPLLIKTFGDGFAALASTYRLPNTTLMLCPDDLLPWLENAFSRLDFAQFTVTSQPLEVAPFHSVLRGLITADVPADPWLETAAVAAALYTKAP